jgi:hypothetical protein
VPLDGDHHKEDHTSRVRQSSWAAPKGLLFSCWFRTGDGA